MTTQGHKMVELIRSVKQSNPLIHCITNHITIRDCANIILAAGGKPIMAEHIKEVEEITRTAAALAVNLGNISDERMSAMMLSGAIARHEKIPQIIDVVGVACSKLRCEFAQKYIVENKPNIIKGNMSEIKEMCGENSNAVGIDVGDGDALSPENLTHNVEIVKAFAGKTGAVVIVTGEKDIITDGENAYIISNGVSKLASVTGTGCMLNALIATYMSKAESDFLLAAITGTSVMGIVGELSNDEKGIGSFLIAIFDNLYNLKEGQLIDMAKIDSFDHRGAANGEVFFNG